MALNVTLYEINLKDIYRMFHPKTTEYTLFFKCTWNNLQDGLHTGPQNLKKFKKNEIISSMFSDYNGIKLEINYRKTSR